MNLGDGSVIQNGIKFHRRSENPQDKVRFIPYPVRAQVKAVYAINNTQNNIYKETTVCDVFVTSKNLPLYRVPVQFERASADNYVHMGTPQAASKNLDGSAFNAEAPNPRISNGDTVIVQFIDGSVLSPIITMMAPSIQSGFNGLSPSPRPASGNGGTTENEGLDVLKIRFNGTNFWIDDNGDVLFESVQALNKAISLIKNFTISLGGDINLGGPSVSSPAVLGDVLANALTTLKSGLETFVEAVSAFATANSSLPGASTLVAACTAEVAALDAFIAQYVTDPATNFNSQQTFLQRGE